MMFPRRLVVVGTIAVLLVGAVGPAVAHETRAIDGNEITFGGADEPLVTGDRMWLEFSVVDAESGDPVETHAANLTVSVQTGDHEKRALEVSEKHGEPGVYEAPVVFTDPGDYVVHLEGSLDGTDVHTHFETTVHDHTDLEYPGDATADEASDGDTDENRTQAAGLGSDLTVAAVVGAIGLLATGVAILLRRQ
ncbi:FixH family protein [Natrinema longum]|uniref:FixH family protein n=1 Tax=Natrinema longum TaxID=370324 RepID=A0A8A2U9X8_9EURY|nr:FixH family protein [Natrinema longum]MBZ6496605.1 FixH family protein [Natrinema longum]QSW85496.1 FixH family protein [Natrinema longum]